MTSEGKLLQEKVRLKKLGGGQLDINPDCGNLGIRQLDDIKCHSQVSTVWIPGEEGLGNSVRKIRGPDLGLPTSSF